MNAIKHTSLSVVFSLLAGISHLPYSVADNTAFSATKTNPTDKRFSAAGHSVSKADACGSSTSISAALDQCGKKGFTFAQCKKKGGNWTCTPSEDRTHPNVRFTGATQNK